MENLFRPKQNASAAEQQAYHQKLFLIAGIINQEAPDVVALQDVGGLEPLTDLQQACEAGTYPLPILTYLNFQMIAV